jgi:hypothetical protein
VKISNVNNLIERDLGLNAAVMQMIMEIKVMNNELKNEA